MCVTHYKSINRPLLHMSAYMKVTKQATTGLIKVLYSLTYITSYKFRTQTFQNFALRYGDRNRVILTFPLFYQWPLSIIWSLQPTYPHPLETDIYWPKLLYCNVSIPVGEACFQGDNPWGENHASSREGILMSCNKNYGSKVRIQPPKSTSLVLQSVSLKKKKKKVQLESNQRGVL